MARLVVALAVVLSGCRHYPQWLVPATVEGQACRRDCMQVRAACDAGRREKRKTCRQREQECLSTCPGAVMVDD